MRKKGEESEKDIIKVLHGHQEELDSINVAHVDEGLINESEQLLTSLGYDLGNLDPAITKRNPIALKQRTWEELVAAYQHCDDTLESLFTEEELKSNALYIQTLNKDFNALHKLDLIDYSISIVAGLLSAAMDILLVGIPKKTPGGLKAGPLSNFIRDRFEKTFKPEEMENLANSKISKVPYDAQDNRNTTIHVEGLSAYYHRLLSLGHDPLLGFFVGVHDILTGKMTTIDKGGKFVSQIMENYADRKETNIFSAIAKQFTHLKSDVTTSMGLPAPLMGLFNLLQFGDIGEEHLTIAQIVQGMYYEGYDFIHFCSMSIPVMVSEVVVRICYAIKRIKEGHSIKDSIPISLNREKHPKLATMLFIAHSSATAINAGKIYFTKNPLAINYPQWMSFAKYSFKQAKWVLIDKPAMRDKYIGGILDEEFDDCVSSIDNTMQRFVGVFDEE